MSAARWINVRFAADNVDLIIAQVYGVPGDPDPQTGQYRGVQALRMFDDAARKLQFEVPCVAGFIMAPRFPLRFRNGELITTGVSDKNEVVIGKLKLVSPLHWERELPLEFSSMKPVSNETRWWFLFGKRGDYAKQDVFGKEGLGLAATLGAWQPQSLDSIHGHPWFMGVGASSIIMKKAFEKLRTRYDRWARWQTPNNDLKGKASLSLNARRRLDDLGAPGRMLASPVLWPLGMVASSEIRFDGGVDEDIPHGAGADWIELHDVTSRPDEKPRGTWTLIANHHRVSNRGFNPVRDVDDCPAPMALWNQHVATAYTDGLRQLQPQQRISVAPTITDNNAPQHWRCTTPSLSATRSSSRPASACSLRTI